ncbi:MAG: hypothetical protein E7773_03385 [Sphingomonas sp.]|uniref:hypothetical protein n=1 Tax=Sphingomonas sp. TaxID=28214 RepID=UPI00120FE1D2|nr:hypothetical protein [Sphingomonas sp.]THD38026.1 MAG: hypothetical protein E7773_03385 [Sphingomonas sp.]
MVALRVTLIATTIAGLIVTAPAHACMPWMGPPMLEGESQQAYAKRADEARLKQIADAQRKRQTDGLQQAATIFVGRFVYWFPPYRPTPPKPGQPPAPPKPIPIPDMTNPGPSYFKPIAWFRGTPTRALVRTRNSYTSCGPMGFGDTTFATEGDLYLFFARKGPLIEKNLIDAIAIDKIDDPTLIEFVAKYRKPAAKTALSPR